MRVHINVGAKQLADDLFQLNLVPLLCVIEDFKCGFKPLNINHLLKRIINFFFFFNASRLFGLLAIVTFFQFIFVSLGIHVGDDASKNFLVALFLGVFISTGVVQL